MLTYLLAAQGAMLTPLPAEMDSTLEPYSGCVFEEFRKRITAAEAAVQQKRTSGTELMKQAVEGCASERRKAVSDSIRALAGNPQFADEAFRAKFVEERFAFLDDTFVWSVSPEGDPDNWK